MFDVFQSALGWLMVFPCLGRESKWACFALRFSACGCLLVWCLFIVWGDLVFLCCF